MESDDTLLKDIETIMRVIYRMRSELMKRKAWLNAEAACIELNKSRRLLMVRKINTINR